MRKYILYAHDGSKNHGCEALVRSTAKVLNVQRDNLVLVSGRPQEDELYGINKICAVVKKGDCGKVKRSSLSFAKAYFDLKFRHKYENMDFILQLSAINAKRGDIALSIGGDTYCYGGTDEIRKTNRMLRYGKLKTVYWGCSIEPELLEDEKIADDIRRYDLITARETISYNALKNVNPNTVLVSDSAFLLDQIQLPLPEGFKEGNTVGINVSPLIMRFGDEGHVFKNYVKLIEHILNNTDMNVCIIPHVIWDHDNDLVPGMRLFEMFSETNRVCIIKDHNAMELKGFISRCRFLVAARTHASIAAYSTNVPTLVVGYSIKSRGIARDIFGTEDNYVIQTQNLTDENMLTNQFVWLCKTELKIKEILKEKMPEYKNRVYSGLEHLKKL